MMYLLVYSMHTSFQRLYNRQWRESPIVVLVTSLTEKAITKFERTWYHSRQWQKHYDCRRNLELKKTCLFCKNGKTNMGRQLDNWVSGQSQLKTTRALFPYQPMVIVCLAEIHWPHWKRYASKEVKEEKREDVNDIRVTFDGSADNEAECNVVLAKGSVVLISQDDQVSGSFLFGSETKNYGESEDSCLFTWWRRLFTFSLRVYWSGRKEYCTGGGHNKWHMVLFGWWFSRWNNQRIIPSLPRSGLQQR